MPAAKLHSPTPWSVRNLAVSLEIVNVRKISIAEMWRRGDRAQEEANAAFIVRCCNNYEVALDLLNSVSGGGLSDDTKKRIAAFLETNS